MAFKAGDGTPFTNRPMARMHDARTAAKKPAQKIVSPTPKAHGESDHSTEVTCPHCGNSFDAGEVAASRDLPHGFSGGDAGGDNEF